MADGYSSSSGRPEGTTMAAGYNVGGRPEGTTLDRGYDVGRSHESDIDFTGCDLPSDWDVSTNTLNISDEKLIQQISVQRNFDQKPLTTRICWQCGRVLWGDGSSKATYLVDPPEGMHSKHAPANAFLKAVDKCNLTFEHDGKKQKWYSCAFCTTSQMPAELYVAR